MRALPGSFRPYGWALSTVEIARIAGVEPHEVLRFDGNTPPRPPSYARPETVARALDEINRYSHGGYPALLDAIAAYVGVDRDQIVLGAGADDLILLCARSLAGPGDTVRVLDEPTYPLLRIAAWLAGAEVDDAAPVFTFCCRPHNPTGALRRVSDTQWRTPTRRARSACATHPGRSRRCPLHSHSPPCATRRRSTRRSRSASG